MIRAVPILSMLAPLLGGCVIPTPEIPPCPDTRDWQAFVNAMPGPGARPTLIVTGTVDVPGGFRPVLDPGPNDRMQPPGQRFTLYLSRDASIPAGPREVRYDLSPALEQYSSITIGCDGNLVARIAPVETAY